MKITKSLKFNISFLLVLIILSCSENEIRPEIPEPLNYIDSSSSENLIETYKIHNISSQSEINISNFRMIIDSSFKGKLLECSSVFDCLVNELYTMSDQGPLESLGMIKLIGEEPSTINLYLDSLEKLGYKLYERDSDSTKLWSEVSKQQNTVNNKIMCIDTFWIASHVTETSNGGRDTSSHKEISKMIIDTTWISRETKMVMDCYSSIGLNRWYNIDRLTRLTGDKRDVSIRIDQSINPVDFKPYLVYLDKNVILKPEAKNGGFLIKDMPIDENGSFIMIKIQDKKVDYVIMDLNKNSNYFIKEVQSSKSLSDMKKEIDAKFGESFN